MAITLSTVPWLSSGVATSGARTPSASLSFLTGKKLSTITFNGVNSRAAGLLHCSFLPSSSSLSSTFSGLSLGLDFATNRANTGRTHRLVVRAGKKYQLCQTKRSRSRKSLARTHGFRYRMSTTSGRAVLKRRRAKGRAILCTKTNPSSGKRVSD